MSNPLEPFLSGVQRMAPKSAVIPQGAEVRALSFEGLLAQARPGVAQSRLSRKPELEQELERLRNEAREAGRSEGREEGRALGFSEGHREGREAFEAAHTEALENFRGQLASLIAEAANSMGDWYEKAEREMTGLVLELAEKTILQELSQRPEATLALVRQALSEVTHAPSARLRVNPAAYPAVSAHGEALLAGAESLRELEIVEDPTLLGGAVIESDGGTIDASVERKLRLVRDELEDVA